MTQQYAGAATIDEVEDAIEAIGKPRAGTDHPDLFIPDRTARFEVYRRAHPQKPYGWRLIGANNLKMAQSQGYVSKSNATRAVRRVVALTRSGLPVRDHTA